MDYEVSQSKNESHSFDPKKIQTKKHVQFNSNVLSHHFLSIYRSNQDSSRETVTFTEKLKSEAEQQVCIYVKFRFLSNFWNCLD